MTNNGISYPNFHSQVALIQHLSTSIINCPNWSCLYGTVDHLAHSYTQQHHYPSKRPPSTMQQLSTVTNCHHMLPADNASPLFWSKSTALCQLWKQVLGQYHTRCLICGFLTSLLSYRIDNDSIYLEPGLKQLLWNCSVHFTALLPLLFTQPMYMLLKERTNILFCHLNVHILNTHLLYDRILCFIIISARKTHYTIPVY